MEAEAKTMNGPDWLLDILTAVREGTLKIEDAASRLRYAPYEQLRFATVDHHRRMRQGIPEVIYCSGKRTEDVVTIVDRMVERGSPVLATRATPEMAQHVTNRHHSAVYYERSGAITIHGSDGPAKPVGQVAVISAGTSDLHVAEEAVVTARMFGSRVSETYDVGVAGIHRLLDRLDVIDKARVIIVVAGMEGALASVVGGLSRVPVIAVPTSVGYGASFHGLAALLTMLNSCAAGVVTVNIDNGFGGGYAAHVINRLGAPEGSSCEPDASSEAVP